jgi:hypothetical protein
MVMRIASLFLASLLALLPAIASAADPHEILLGPTDRYEVSETEQWSFAIQRELSGRFADVKIKPKRGDAFVLMLYFLADTPDLARLDTPEKIASSVIAGAEKYLPLSVEKKVALQPVSPRSSYGSLTVLTAAATQGVAGEFKYQTRGMVRLSPDAALGFSLLSKEINNPAYRQLLNYVYSFIKLAPNVAAAPVATAPTPVARPSPAPKIERAPQIKAAPVPRPGNPVQRGPQRDIRDCLKLPTDAEIMQCVNTRG